MRELEREKTLERESACEEIERAGLVGTGIAYYSGHGCNRTVP